MRLIALAAALLLSATAAQAQSWNSQRSGDFTYYNGVDSNGGALSGTAMRNGDFTYYNGIVNGQAQSCTSMQIGSSAYTTCN